LATVTYDSYVYDYPPNTAVFPDKVTVPTSPATSTVTATTATNTVTTTTTVTPATDVTTTPIVPGTMSNASINVTPSVVVDTEIDISDIDLNPDGTEVTVADIFDGLTKNPVLDETDTGWTVKGEGVFDDFMETAYKHLDAQFLSNRIKQEDYANEHLQMYLTTLQMMSGQWIQFKIQSQQLKLQAAIESKRLAVQVALANKENEIRIAQFNQDNSFKVASTNLQTKTQVDLNNQQSEMQIDLANNQNKNQVSLANAQNTLAASEATARTAVQVALGNSQHDLEAKSRTAQIKQEVDLAIYQMTSQVSMTNAQNRLQLESTQENLESQERQNKERIQAQAALIAAQVETEIQKKHLHRRQIEGFDEDYKQKVFKMMLDGNAVGMSVARDSFVGTNLIPSPIGKGSIDRMWEIIQNDLDGNLTTTTNPQLTDRNVYFRAKSTLGTKDMA
jgi:hypothetical protein